MFIVIEGHIINTDNIECVTASGDFLIIRCIRNDLRFRLGQEKALRARNEIDVIVKPHVII